MFIWKIKFILEIYLCEAAAEELAIWTASPETEKEAELWFWSRYCDSWASNQNSEISVKWYH